MTRRIVYFSLLLSVAVLAISCSKKTGRPPFDGPTVSSVTLTGSDSTSYALSNGGRCYENVEVSVEFPENYKDADAVEQLRRLVLHHVLALPDSVATTGFMPEFVRSLISYNAPNQDASPDDEEDGAQPSDRFRFKTTVKLVYNKYNIASYARQDVTTKNGEPYTSVTTYYNFDLEKMALIELDDMFTADALSSDIGPLLVKEILIRNNASNDDELSEKGFFNISNLIVTSNFFFTEEGVRWSFMPNELAVAAVGEPQAEITYEDLVQFLSDGSILKRFFYEDAL